MPRWFTDAEVIILNIKQIIEDSFTVDVFIHCKTAKSACDFAKQFWNAYYKTDERDIDIVVADECAVITARNWWRDKEQTCYRIKNGLPDSAIPLSYIETYPMSYPYKVLHWEVV